MTFSYSNSMYFIIWFQEDTVDINANDTSHQAMLKPEDVIAQVWTENISLFACILIQKHILHN